MTPNDSLQTAFTSFTDALGFWLKLYALVLSVFGVLMSTKRLARLWKTRHLRRVWGIRDRDSVIVVCSELNKPRQRQNVEPREFIYSLKYGDIDAYFEVVITLLRLFPNIKLRLMSSGEAENTRVDLARHLILVGGPDYNAITATVLKKKVTQYQYRSPYVDVKSKQFPKEIVLYDSSRKREFCELTEERDYGYFERIRNPNNPEKNIILIGGCHTVGVTGAVKAFSMAESEQGEIPKIVLANAKKVASMISGKREFSILFSVERVGQTINVPIAVLGNIFVQPAQ